MRFTQRLFLIVLTLELAVRAHPAACAPAKGVTPAKPATSAQAGLGVEEYMKHADRHHGSVIVEGVVTSASKAKGMLSLVDRKEYDACGLSACAEYTLPIRWTGAMPDLKATVRVTGEAKTAGRKLVFVASSVNALQASGASK